MLATYGLKPYDVSKIFNSALNLPETSYDVLICTGTVLAFSAKSRHRKVIVGESVGNVSSFRLHQKHALSKFNGIKITEISLNKLNERCNYQNT